MRKIKVKTYLPESGLPKHIVKRDSGLWVEEKIIAEGSAGPYDVLWDFGKNLASTRDVVPLQERFRENTENIIFLGLVDEQIKNALEANTRLVNNHEANPDNPEQRFAYQQNLAKVYRILVGKTLEFAGVDAVLFPPKRGGELVAKFFEIYGDFPSEKIADYTLKRIVLNDGSILAGVRDINFWPAITTGITIIFADDCLASFISAYATLDWARQKTNKQPFRLAACVSTATQRGVEWLLRAASNFGYKEIKFIGGLPIFGMTEEYYLLRLPDEGFSPGTYAVGDMGLWTRALPEKFNHKAPWNVGRKPEG